jgi:hypothetical protein
VDISGVFGLKIGFTDHFNTPFMTMLNYCTVTNLQTLQITPAQAKSFQSPVSSPLGEEIIIV